MLSAHKLTPLEKHASKLLLAIPFLLSIFLIVGSSSVISPTIHSALLGIGGAFLGASLGTSLGLLVGARQHRNVEDALKMHNEEFHQLKISVLELPGRTLNFPLLSSEQYISKYRTVFHKYHKTRKQGEEFWIYSTIDFGQEFSSGRLRGKGRYLMNNKIYTYDINGYFLGVRFVLTLEGISHIENPSIEIYPGFGTFLDPEAGFMGIHLHLDWDEKDGFDPCLIVAAPYPGTEQEGRQSYAVCEDLDRRWAEKRLPVGMLK